VTFTDEERSRISDILGSTESSHHPWVIDQIEAVLPAYARRVRAQVLRDAADQWEFAYTDPDVLRWLRARVDAEEGKP
jgi:hypothetical protein